MKTLSLRSKKELSYSIKKYCHSPKIVNIMYIPALLFFILLIFYPFFQGIIISFKEWNGYSPKFLWVGFQKYKKLLTDRDFFVTVKNTLIYGIGSTLIQNFFGLGCAVLLDQKIKGEKIIRTVVYLPVVISALIMGYVWYFFFKFEGGAINDIMLLFGLKPLDWLALGKRSVWIITLVNSIQYMGISMVIYLAGLQGISRTFYEAASIDGATRWAQFKNVTIPLLMPAITTSVIINIIGGLKLFDVIMAMTKGGPGYSSASISTMMYQIYFVRMDAGYAAAMGIVMFLLISIISIINLRYLRNKEVQM